MGQMISVNARNFSEAVLESPAPVVVDFWATWCGPCRQLSPTVDALATEYEGYFRFAQVDVDQDPGIAQVYRVERIPTLLLLFGGVEIGRFVGPLSKAQLADRLAAALPLVA